jgi:hypothetical protein
LIHSDLILPSLSVELPDSLCGAKNVSPARKEPRIKHRWNTEKGMFKNPCLICVPSVANSWFRPKTGLSHPRVGLRDREGEK